MAAGHHMKSTDPRRWRTTTTGVEGNRIEYSHRHYRSRFGSPRDSRPTRQMGRMKHTGPPDGESIWEPCCPSLTHRSVGGKTDEIADPARLTRAHDGSAWPIKRALSTDVGANACFPCHLRSTTSFVRAARQLTRIVSSRLARAVAGVAPGASKRARLALARAVACGKRCVGGSSSTRTVRKTRREVQRRERRIRPSRALHDGHIVDIARRRVVSATQDNYSAKQRGGVHEQPSAS